MNTHKMYRLDSSGHGLVASWSRDRLEVNAAAKLFAELKGKGFTMFELEGSDTKTIMKEFDPTAKEILAVPRLVGG